MAKAKPKAGKTEPKLRLIGVRATEEWATWLEGLAEEHRTTVAGLIDRALTEWAAERGHKAKPPKRTP